MRLLIYGIVQGVGFRPTVYRIAKSLGLKGYVRNNGSNVDIIIDKKYKQFISRLRGELPPLARIDRVEIIKDKGFCRKYPDFTIIPSAIGSGLEKCPSIPPDTALCPECRKDITSPRNRRYGYPFTNCTNCGARYSVIMSLPYDRNNTSMAPFKLCSDCIREYNDPLDRRFHAQTISCPDDGPLYMLYDAKKRKVDTDDPVQTFAKLIDNGKIGVAKSWGGMHIICAISQIERLRKWYGRPYKPFAIMVRDQKCAKRYAMLDDCAKKLLMSPQRPIVLLPKRKGAHNDRFLEDVSPGLGNIGIYLPYAGFHHELFHELKNDVIISTSANPMGEPMITDNKTAFLLGLDCYLLHNRDIINRVDDSVVIPFQDRSFFIRRSRGYVPIAVKINHKKSIVSFGGEENVTSAVSKNGSLYISQYIGDTAHYNVYQFLDTATEYLCRLVGVDRISGIGIDLHPQYPNRRLAREWADKHKTRLVQIQHHWAHAASLLVDNRINGPIVALTLDGTGYGMDGTVWGGEVLITDFKRFERIGTLQKIPLIGGDAAIVEPNRIVFAILEMLGKHSDYYNHQSAEILRKAMKQCMVTSSFGRMLDALSYMLGVCTKMTYDGEPAMKLEKYLVSPSDFEEHNEFSTENISTSEGKIVQTLPLFERLYDILRRQGVLSEKNKNILAHYFVREVLKSLVEIAADEAEKRDIEYIGLTGGVSYNLPITMIVKNYTEARGFKFLMHARIPNGDGGISTGQNAIVGNLIND